MTIDIEPELLSAAMRNHLLNKENMLEQRLTSMRADIANMRAQIAVEEKHGDPAEGSEATIEAVKNSLAESEKAYTAMKKRYDGVVAARKAADPPVPTQLPA